MDSSLGTPAVNVDLDHTEETGRNDAAALLTYFVSSEGTGVLAPESPASEGTEEGKPSDDSLGETAQLLHTDGLLTSALESMEASSQMPLRQTQSGAQVYVEPEKSGPYVQSDTPCLTPVDQQECVPHSESFPIAARGPPAGSGESPTDIDCSTYNGASRLQEGSGGNTGISTGHTAPDLSDLELIDPDPASFAGQIIYLDFDGANDVVYNGPVTVGPFDVPAFQAPGRLAGQEHAIILHILAGLEKVFAGSGVVFTISEPPADQPHSTIYLGGDDSVFLRYGSFLGLAEQVDTGNKNADDTAFVFSNEITARSIDSGGYAASLTQLIAHETGHLLGYGHSSPSGPDEPLLAKCAADELPIVVGDTWRYAKGTNQPPANWNDVGFDDRGWLAGPTGIGYSTDITYPTQLNDMQYVAGVQDGYASFYVRRPFNIPNVSSITALELGGKYDDGFIAYINGHEISSEQYYDAGVLRLQRICRRYTR